MPAPPPPPVHRRPLSPSPSSSVDMRPLTRRRLFSTPLQPPLAVLPPPRHTLSFKVNVNPDVPILPPPRHALSFKIGDSPTPGFGNDIGVFIRVIDLLYFFTFLQPDRPDPGPSPTQPPLRNPCKRCLILLLHWPRPVVETMINVKNLRWLKRMYYRTIASKHFCRTGYNVLMAGHMSFRTGMSV